MIQLKDLIKEEWIERSPLTEEQKQGLLEKIGNYNNYGQQIYSQSDPVQVAAELNEIIQFAEKYLSETMDAFDAITMKRNLKEVKNYAVQFTKTATEHKATGQRLQTLYEDMGQILNRYFDIKDLQ